MNKSTALAFTSPLNRELVKLIYLLSNKNTLLTAHDCLFCTSLNSYPPTTFGTHINNEMLVQNEKRSQLVRYGDAHCCQQEPEERESTSLSQFPHSHSFNSSPFQELLKMPFHSLIRPRCRIII